MFQARSFGLLRPKLPGDWVSHPAIVMQVFVVTTPDSRHLIEKWASTYEVDLPLENVIVAN
eukprot:scaffold664818_cov61-Prasinocladus_malaysianus.AAC.1